MPEFSQDELSEAIANALIQVRKPRTSWDRILTIASTIASVIALVFVIGVNWRRIEDLEVRQKEQIELLSESRDEITTLREELLNREGDWKVVRTQLDTLTHDIAEIKGAVYRPVGVSGNISGIVNGPGYRGLGRVPVFPRK